MLPYAELVEAVATVPRVTVHGPWSRTVEHALLNTPVEVIDTSLSLCQRLP